MERRHFFTSALATALAPLSSALAAGTGRPVRILLRSSWQTVNIGDIGHTPGVLTLLEKHLPEVEVWLYPSKVDNGVDALLKARFPKLIIAATPEEQKAAFAQCDYLLHSSGPSLVAQKDVARWHEETGKPYGIYGITFASDNKVGLDLLSAAKFVFFRDSHSLAYAKEHGVNCPVMEFGPDGAFAVDLRDDAPAVAFLEKHGLQEGQFLCCIPRLRITPYWAIPSKKAKFNETSHARNEAMKEHDHAPLREAIIQVVRQTPMKVLLCPEDETQMAVGKEMIYDKLPEDVKAKVVWRDAYWLTGEALSTYVRSAGLFGNEMHSPIMCIGNGIPAMVCRWQEQTTKGYMWKDIGLGEWLFNFDNEDEVAKLAPAVLAMAKDPAGAKAKALKAREFVQQRQRDTMSVVKKSLPAI